MNKNFKILSISFIVAFVFANACFSADEIHEIQKQQQHAQNKIKKLKLLEKQETNKLYKNQQKLEETENSLNKNKEIYTKTKVELEDLKSKLSSSLVDYQDLKANANKRIITLYKTKRKKYVEFLLNAKDLNNLTDRLYFENIVMRLDKENLKMTQVKTRRIMNLKEKIEIKEKRVAENIKSMNRQQENIQSAISQNEKYIEKLKTDRATWERAERELAKQSRMIETFINKTTEKEANVVATSGTFTSPVSGRVSSNYGWRVHPIFKKNIFHSGVDLAAKAGTTVKAANSGKVIYSGWYGGYGKVVIIDHGKIGGKATTTLYAHMSTILVSVGKSVQRGQAIGRVGSTGYSTGPHLHFEVRVNGATQNPFNYIPR